MTDERKASHIQDLPSTLHNALKALAADDVVKAALGKHLYQSFHGLKEPRMVRLSSAGF